MQKNCNVHLETPAQDSLARSLKGDAKRAKMGEPPLCGPGRETNRNIDQDSTSRDYGAKATERESIESVGGHTDQENWSRDYGRKETEKESIDGGVSLQ